LNDERRLTRFPERKSETRFFAGGGVFLDEAGLDRFVESLISQMEIFCGVEDAVFFYEVSDLLGGGFDFAFARQVEDALVS